MAPVSRDGNNEASTSRNPLPPAPTGSGSKPHNVHLPYINRSFHLPQQFHSMAAGAGAGFVASIVTCPLDVVKTRLQAQQLSTSASDYEGVRLTVLRIWRQSGFRGFYRGLGPTLGGYLPTWGIYFTVYDIIKDRLGDWARESSHPEAETTLTHIVAAMSAGAVGTLSTNPLWVVKTRFMAQAILPPSAPRYRHTFQAIASIYRHEGFGAFYKGLLPSLMGVSHVAVQFPLYEKAKSWADNGDHSTLPPTTILACSAFSKMIASLITYPHEVLRTRLQIRNSSSHGSHPSTPTTPSPLPTGSSLKPPEIFPPNGRHTLYSPLVTGSNPPVPSSHVEYEGYTGKWQVKQGGVVDTFVQIRRQDGWRGFYRGLSINLVRTLPSSAITMLSYELIMRRLA